MPKKSTPWQEQKKRKGFTYADIHHFISTGLFSIAERDIGAITVDSVKGMFKGEYYPIEPIRRIICDIFEIDYDLGDSWFDEQYEVYHNGHADRIIKVTSPNKKGPNIKRSTPWNRLRKARNYKIRDIADVMGVTVDTVSSWMNGRTMPSTKHLATLCAMFCIRPEDGFAMAVDGCRMYAQYKKKRDAHQITFEELLRREEK